MQNSSIQWTDHTFNPWIGCTKISPGCKNCYAEFATPTRTARAQGRELWGKGKARSRTSDAYWKQPLAWNKAAAGQMATSFHPQLSGPLVKRVTGRPRVFCASLADWLDDEVPIEWLARLLKLIHDTPNLDWLLLTKRPQNWRDRLEEADGFVSKEGDVIRSEWLWAWRYGDAPPHNIWIGATIEDQPRADQRTPALLKIPAAIRFLSVEPMLERIDFVRSYPFLAGKKIHWAIFGGESGPNARPCHLEWIRDGLRQCRAAAVAPFVKQLGRDPHWSEQDMAEKWYESLSDKKGADMSEWPPDLRIRQFPRPHVTM